MKIISLFVGVHLRCQLEFIFFNACILGVSECISIVSWLKYSFYFYFLIKLHISSGTSWFVLYDLYFFYVWSCQNIHHLELYWNSYCNRNMIGSWGLFPLVPSLLPSPNLHWCLVHAVTCANFLLLVKYYPSFSEVFAGLANKECLAVFYVTEVVFWTKPDLLMKKYLKGCSSGNLYRKKISIDKLCSKPTLFKKAIWTLNHPWVFIPCHFFNTLLLLFIISLLCYFLLFEKICT